VADDWFRSAEWSEAAREGFEARLRRARPYNRAQYLRIKGLALAEAGEVDAARDLWLRVLQCTDERTAGDRATALEHLGASYANDDPAAAEAFYRRLLTEFPTLKGTSYTVEIALAELLAERGREEDVEEALGLLESFISRGMVQFPDVLFRWHLVLVRLSELTGETDQARRSARAALELANRGPVFSRHKEVGVVRIDRRTLRRLRELAG